MDSKEIGGKKVFIVHYKHNGVTYEALFDTKDTAKWFEDLQ